MKYTVFTQGELQTNCTVLQKDGSCVVVDIAYGAHELFSYIAENNLKVAAVLLTHGHFDHCGGVRQFFEVCNVTAPIFVHSADAELCKAAADNIWGITAIGCAPTNFVHEGALSVENFKFDVFETPGHTAGSVCYLIENLLFSGDTLMRESIGRTDFSESVPSKMCTSLKKLCKLQDDFTVICGHGGLTTLNYEKSFNPYLTELKRHGN